jgi:hypothetical protein
MVAARQICCFCESSETTKFLTKLESFVVEHVSLLVDMDKVQWKFSPASLSASFNSVERTRDYLS